MVDVEHRDHSCDETTDEIISCVTSSKQPMVKMFLDELPMGNLFQVLISVESVIL